MDAKGKIDAILRFFADNIPRVVEEESRSLPFRDVDTSPLEEVVGMALWMWVCMYNFQATFRKGGNTASFEKLPFESLPDIRAKPQLSLAVWNEVKVGKFRADFVVHYRSGGKAVWIAIECDGHQFHEKTKEQAERDRSRDRFFQNEGLAILRFTGAEIWRDPLAILFEISDFAMKRVSE